jgi:anti-sigma regulatory factor (Ser/Thr protein kinase)
MAPAERFSTELRIVRSLSELPSLADFVRQTARAQRLEEEVEYGLQLAAEELFTNMVKYGAEGAPEILVQLSGGPIEVKMVFQDRGGQPFDPTGIQPRDFDKPADERRPGGLGIHLVRSYMDDFRYEYREGTGITTVIKRMGKSRV